MARFRPLRERDVSMLSQYTPNDPFQWGEVYVLTDWIGERFRDVRFDGERARYWWDPDGMAGIEATFRLATHVVRVEDRYEWRVYRNGSVRSGMCKTPEVAQKIADAMHEVAWLFPRVGVRPCRETEDLSVAEVPLEVGSMRLLPWVWYPSPRRCYDRYVRVWARTPGTGSDLVERAYTGAWQGAEIRQHEKDGPWVWRVRIEEEKRQGTVPRLMDAFSAVSAALGECVCALEGGLTRGRRCGEPVPTSACPSPMGP